MLSTICRNPNNSEIKNNLSLKLFKENNKERLKTQNNKISPGSYKQKSEIKFLTVTTHQKVDVQYISTRNQIKSHITFK